MVTDRTAEIAAAQLRKPGDQHVLAVDVGGTKLAVGLVDGNGQVLRMLRTPTPTPVVPDSGRGGSGRHGGGAGDETASADSASQPASDLESTEPGETIF